MEYIIEEKRVGRFIAKVWQDDSYREWGDVLCDEPMLVFSIHRGGTHVLFDNSKTVPQCLDVLSCIEDAEWLEAIWHADGMAEVETLEDGRVRVESEYFARPRYFKTLESAAKRTILESCGLDLEDVQVQRFSTQDSEVYVAWYQGELDRYAGMKNAKAPTETVRAYLDGDVYGFTVEDVDGDVLESCWGFIGDWTYCLTEGEDVARYLEGEASKTETRRLEASRPDLYAIS